MLSKIKYFVKCPKILWRLKLLLLVGLLFDENFLAFRRKNIYPAI